MHHLLSAPPRHDFWTLFKERAIPTLMFWAMYTVFGMSSAVLGPALPFLQCQVKASESQMNWVLFSQLGFVLLGTVITSPINKLPKNNWTVIFACNSILLVSGLALPVTTVLVTICHSPGLLGLVMAVMGLNMGCIDNLANIQIIHLYGEAVAPFMQTMHFLYGFGAFMTQVITDPFLSELSENCTSIEWTNSSLAINVADLRNPFWIIGATQFAVFLLIPIMTYKGGVSFTPYTVTKEEEMDQQSTKYTGMELDGADHIEKTAKSLFVKDICVIILAAVLCFLLDGIQSEYNGYVYEYAMQTLPTDNDKKTASYIGFCFWGLFSLGRFIAIFITLRFPTTWLLNVDMIGLFFGAIFVLSGSTSLFMLYLGSCLLGLSLSNTTPSVFSLAEEYVNLTKWRMTALVVCAALGEALTPLGVGTIMTSNAAMAFSVTNCGLVLVVITIYFVLMSIGVRTKKSMYISAKWSDNVMGEETAVKFYSRMDAGENYHATVP